ncbi:772_t:CDS:2 [Ambispora gerdemannii]|uniref:histone deacetylase n=1 Tax=Ambispora gerdemannii TaxID=144530 RepID=A0A9N8WNB6_9GLOM|nr:772_t:CDS:2 [Ambispora gerdemannii]
MSNSKKPVEKVPIVYHPGYNIVFWNLEKIHPFDTQKYKRIHKILVSSNLFEAASFHEPTPPTEEELLNLHSQKYLESLKSNTALQRILEVPFVAVLPQILMRKKVLEPMLLQTGGSVLAAELALRYGWAINLGGGFHHAHYNGGGGFCVYADISMMVGQILNNPQNRVNRLMIVDLDAHQGNGPERDLADNNKVLIVDAFNANIYPHDTDAISSITTPILLATPALKRDDQYLPLVQSKILQSFRKFQPDFIIYNAGTDCLEGDPLGAMDLTPDGIIKRDEMVFRMALDHNVPVAMVLSGGYQKKNAEIIGASILNLVMKFNLLEPNRMTSLIYEENS